MAEYNLESSSCFSLAQGLPEWHAHVKAVTRLVRGLLSEIVGWSAWGFDAIG